MTDINSIVLVGRLTSEPKLESVGTSSKCTFSIANNRSYKKGEEWKNEASFFEVVTWGTFADRISSKLVKGELIVISGRLQQDRWEKDGQKQSRIYIIADSIEPCTSTKGETTKPQETIASPTTDATIDLW